jgi:hypothetical protein
MFDGGFTLFLRSACGLLLARRPGRTSMGAFGGVTAATLIDTFKTLFPVGVNVAALTDLRLACAGAFVVNVDLLWKREVFSDDIEEKFAAIGRAKKEGDLSPAQVRMAYINLLEGVLKVKETPHPPVPAAEEVSSGL